MLYPSQAQWKIHILGDEEGEIIYQQMTFQRKFLQASRIDSYLQPFKRIIETTTCNKKYGDLFCDCSQTAKESVDQLGYSHYSKLILYEKDVTQITWTLNYSYFKLRQVKFFQSLVFLNILGWFVLFLIRAEAWRTETPFLHLQHL